MKKIQKAAAAIAVLLVAVFAISVVNSQVVKPIRLHFAVSSACGVMKEYGRKFTPEAKQKVSIAFRSAAHLDPRFIQLSQAAFYRAYGASSTPFYSESSAMLAGFCDVG